MSTVAEFIDRLGDTVNSGIGLSRRPMYFAGPVRQPYAGENHKVHIYSEYQSVCPIVGIGTNQ
jgi:hypothetical protein